MTDFKHKSGSIARNSETMQSDAVRPQKGLLYVDSQAIDLYEQLIGNDWKESHDHLFGSRRQERRRRQISKQDSPNLQLGLHFPCMIKNLSLVSYPNDVTSGAQNLARMVKSIEKKMNFEFSLLGLWISDSRRIEQQILRLHSKTRAN